MAWESMLNKKEREQSIEPQHRYEWLGMDIKIRTVLQNKTKYFYLHLSTKFRK
jgi:hypothetical protein